MLGLRIRHLLVVGRGKEPARVNFGPGLNVIWGAANTGKSHVLKLIDFAFGAGTPPEAPPEQQGYEGVLLGLESLDGKNWTLCRSLLGGDIRKLEGLHDQWPANDVGEVLASTHRPSNSLSRFLLGVLGMQNVRLRRNARGETQELSFRNLAHLVLVTEGKIQSELPPIETGQFVSRTNEFSLFKYLITGTDDSSIQKSDRNPSDKARIAAQLELIDSQIADADQLVKQIGDDREEIGERQERLDLTMGEVLQNWENASGDYRFYSARRRALVKDRDALLDRADEIALLLKRFALLELQYVSDDGRLRAIEEAASIFGALSDGPCPWCGAAAGHQATEAAVICEGDDDVIVAAASAEREKINIKRKELADTVSRLEIEEVVIDDQLTTVDSQIEELNENIQRELPDVQVTRARLNDVVAERDRTQAMLARFENLDRLKQLRAEITGDSDVDSVSIIAQDGIGGTTLDEFSQSIEGLLSAWQFPGQRVFFDLPRRDIQIAGKARRINGKGVRAVLHAAFSLALLKFTADKDRPHTRFLALDSPLVTYRDPLGDPLSPDEAALAMTDLNERFYLPFRNWNQDLQVIILENRDPPSWISEVATVEKFTGDPRFGRAGFYR